MTTTISVTDARTRLPELVDDVAANLNEYVITKHGRAYAILVPVAEYEALLETVDILRSAKAMRRIRRGLKELGGKDVHYVDGGGDAWEPE